MAPARTVGYVEIVTGSRIPMAVWYLRDTGRGRDYGTRVAISFSPRSQRLALVVRTTMSSILPPEILDLIVDHLIYEPTTLKACCVVSKSWIPRARKHLFAHIRFSAEKSHIKRWRKAFPDPSTSPAHYTRNLSFHGLLASVAVDANTGSWIRTFRRVMHLRVNTLAWDDSRVSLVQLHGLSPTLKSLTLTYTSVPSSEVLGLVCSFPLLEDLWLVSVTSENDTDRWSIPSTSPKLTGSLGIMGSIRSAARRLCDLPGGLRFSKVTVSCSKEDVDSIMHLVSKCSDTLESFAVSYPSGASTSASVIGQGLTTVHEHRCV